MRLPPEMTMGMSIRVDRDHAFTIDVITVHMDHTRHMILSQAIRLGLAAGKGK